MKASTIQRYLSGRCRGQFMGVFSCDTLPRHVPKRPAIIVCNTDPSDRSGEHWICIYISGNRHGEFFDSFGRKPGSPFCEFLIDIAYIGHITINNYKIYLVPFVELTVCFLQFIRVMDTICRELNVLLLTIL